MAPCSLLIQKYSRSYSTTRKLQQVVPRHLTAFVILAIIVVLLFYTTHRLPGAGTGSYAPKLTRAATAQASVSMTSNKERALGAITGALVADAATMGLHWIYDTSKIASLLQAGKRGGQPEFFEPPSCPFYQMPSGALSPYGGELHALLLYVAQHKDIQGASWASFLAKYFKEVYPGYKNHSIKTLIANVDGGKTYPETGDPADTQANCLCKVPVVTAKYAGTDQLPAALEAAVRAQQNNDTSVLYGLAAARILEKVILGSSIEEALSWASQPGNLPAPAAKIVEGTLAAKDKPFNDAVKGFGSSCAMPGAFQSALLAAASAGSYQEGVRLNMMAGGDNCSRGIYVGALLGAAHGSSAVPSAWKARVTGMKEMEVAAEGIFSS